jgi:hypothetical protein
MIVHDLELVGALEAGERMVELIRRRSDEL